MFDTLLFDLIKEIKRIYDDSSLTDAEALDRIDVAVTMADNEIDSAMNRMAQDLSPEPVEEIA